MDRETVDEIKRHFDQKVDEGNRNLGDKVDEIKRHFGDSVDEIKRHFGVVKEGQEAGTSSWPKGWAPGSTVWKAKCAA